MSDSESEIDENESFQIARKTIAIGTGEGLGKVLFASGNQFEGEYRKCLRHGHGIFSFSSGARYEGDWKNGLKHGFGKFTYPDGSFYCGDWKLNKKNGFGKYVYENGDIYEGSWKDDLKHGVGTYKYELAKICLKATWINGTLKGPIEIDYGIFRYHGYWKDYSSVGEGAFSFSMKYMLPGHIERVYRPSTGPSVSNESFKEFKIKSSVGTKTGKNIRESLKLNDDAQGEDVINAGDCVPRFIAHEIKIYDYSKLPQQPLCLPQQDSVTSVCTKSSQSGLSENSVHQPQQEPAQGDESSQAGISEKFEEDLNHHEPSIQQDLQLLQEDKVTSNVSLVKENA